jgi:3',5'-cyclic AMP phosphodiesterase CpdA
VITRIAHLSDIHFGGELPAATAAAIAAVNELAPTVIAVTGDLTLNGLPVEFRAAQAWLAQLSAPTVVTPGNHDTPYWNLILRALRPFDRYRRYIGPAQSAGYDAPDLCLRALNSARGAQPRLDWSKGAIGLESLRTIDWPQDARARIFACHHPLIELQDAPVTGGVRCGVEAAAILAAADVDLVLTGHVHVPFALPMGPAGSCYSIGAGTLSLRTRGAPPSFTTIVMTEEAFDVTVQAWTGEAFAPAEHWRLPRRRRCS